MGDAKPIASPMATSTSLLVFEGTIFYDPTLYCRTIGALQYLCIMRLIIAFAVNKLSQFMHKPLKPHWQVAKCLLCYLKQTMTSYLQFRRSSSNLIQAFSYADWAGSRDDRHSIGGFFIFLGPNLISWSCRKQKMVAKSSTELEYIALANAAVDIQWLKSLLHELGVISVRAPVLWCDNIGATYLSSNLVYHAHMKHIEIDFHFIRDMVNKKTLDI